MRGFLLLAVLLFQAPPVPPPVPQDDAAVHQEMEELILQVERRQMAIDKLLYEASTGRQPAQGVAGSGIGELLRASRDGGEAVQRDMARILELALSHVHAGGT